MIVFFTVVLVNYSISFAQPPEYCGCDGTNTTDTITVEIPGFPNCFAFITFEKTICEGLENYETRILYMDFIVDNCPTFRDSLYPFGTNNPPDEFFMRRMWIALTSKMQQEYLNRILITYIPSYKAQFYCTGNPNQTTIISHSFIQGHCHKFCYAYYYKPWPTSFSKNTTTDSTDNQYRLTLPPFGFNPNSFIRVQYLDCDVASCCQTQNKFCIDPITGQLVLVSSENFVVVNEQCDYTNPTVCVYLNLTSIGYILIPFSADCETSCPWE
ncbi:MAG: hypothetical protein JNL36_06355 [Candidatus Kapabacteria bacterium]|nr:hypothetical protein [Candidatus Kapabacteria bacterium]